MEYYEQELQITHELKDRQGEALALVPLANVYYLLGRPEKSIEYFELALPINREFKNYFRVSNNLNGLGNDYDALGKYEKAIELFEQGLAVAREKMDIYSHVSPDTQQGASDKLESILFKKAGTQ